MSEIFKEIKKNFSLLKNERYLIIGKLHMILYWCDSVLEDEEFDSLKVDRIKLQRIKKQTRILIEKLQK